MKRPKLESEGSAVLYLTKFWRLKHFLSLFVLLFLVIYFIIGKSENRKSRLHRILQQQLATFTHLCGDLHLRCHLLRGNHSHSTTCSYACGSNLRFSILHKGTLKCTCQRSDNLSFHSIFWTTAASILWWLACYSISKWVISMVHLQEKAVGWKHLISNILWVMCWPLLILHATQLQ